MLEHIADGKALILLVETKREAGEPFPNRRTIYKWCEDYPDFGAQFARARIDGAHAVVDDGHRIMDDRTADPDPSSRKLRFEGRLKLAACFCPDVYGAKARMEHTGKDGGPIQTETRHSVVSDLLNALGEGA